LPYDFIVKTGPSTDLRESTLKNFPWADAAVTAKARALRLACLTADYSPLWNRMSRALRGALPWSSSDPRLAAEALELGDDLNWSTACSIRSPFARRYALVEIDVLVARALGLSLDDLLEMYRTYFNVFETNEKGTWYDSAGRVVWTWSKGIGSVGWKDKDRRKPSEATWLRDFADMSAGSTLHCEVEVDFLPSGAGKAMRTFVAPFTTCDREADYRQAWAYFDVNARLQVA
jgi:hypothetical protein